MDGGGGQSHPAILKGIAQKSLGIPTRAGIRGKENDFLSISNGALLMRPSHTRKGQSSIDDVIRLLEERWEVGGVGVGVRVMAGGCPPGCFALVT